jgi:mRNA interferase MazF
VGRFVKGDVVVVPFPFSDLTRAKRRPALVVARVSDDDVILCQITSQDVRDGYALSLVDSDFQDAGLRRPSNVRPNRIFTADARLILYRIGGLKREKASEVTEAIVRILRE